MAGSKVTPTTTFSNVIQSDVLASVIALASKTSIVNREIDGKSSMWSEK